MPGCILVGVREENEAAIPGHIFRGSVGTEFLPQNLEQLSTDVRMQLKLILKMGCEGVDWIHLAESTVQCQALVNTVTNIQVP